MTHAVQVHIQSLGQSERDDFLNKRLSSKTQASAATSREAFSSFLPMVADLGTYAMSSDPISVRESWEGQLREALSNPSVGLANSAFDAARGITGSALRGEQFSQRDGRAVQSLLPFSNFMPVVWATNAMIGGLPKRDTHKHPSCAQGVPKGAPCFFYSQVGNIRTMRAMRTASHVAVSRLSAWHRSGLFRIFDEE